MPNLLTHFPWLFGHPENPRIEVDKYGVSLLSAQSVTHFTWHEVGQIDALRKELPVAGEVILEFTLKSSDYVISISDKFSDFELLVRFLESEWPKIPGDWRTRIAEPVAAECRATLFPEFT